MKEKKNTTANVNASAPSTLTHVAAPSKLGTLNAFKTTTKTASLTDLHLHKFMVIEAEAAAEMNRSALLVTFADGINWPFRTKEAKVDGVDTTVIQVSSGWVRQLESALEPILDAFKAFCRNGHLVNPAIQSTFDSTFKRPGYHYTCPTCGAVMVTSYKLVKEATTRGCIPCQVPASQMTCVKVS